MSENWGNSAVERQRINSTSPSMYRSTIDLLSPACGWQASVLQRAFTEEVRNKQKFSFLSFLSAWNTDRMYFHLQILFCVCFVKIRYHCIPMDYCRILSMVNVWGTHCPSLSFKLIETHWTWVLIKTVFPKEEQHTKKYSPLSNKIEKFCVKCN